MSLNINLNTASMNAHRNLSMTNARLGQSIERLSSGYRINRGADDPAGLVNSESLRAQIGGLSQAISNSQDAVNLVKTAEGSLTEVHSLLRSMRDLAVHAANSGANSAESVAADQAQIKSAVESLNRISSQTAFGSKKLLDGSASIGFGTVVAGGAGTPAAADLTGVKAASTNSAFLAATGDKAVTVTVNQAAAQAKQTGAAAVVAGAGGALSTAAGWTASTTSTLKVNGVNIGTFGATQTGDDVINAVNNNATLNQSVVASRDGSNKIVLTSRDYGSSKGITVEETLQDATGAGGAATANILATGTVDTTDNAAHATTVAQWGKDIQGTVSGNGVGGGAVAFNAGTGFTMKSAAGDEINFSTAMAGGASSTYATNVTGNGTTFQIGANQGETATVNLASTAANNLGKSSGSTVFASVANVDVTSNAGEVIKVLDAAISQISTQRASLGAFQKNVLESNMNSLGVTKENVAASESSIRDADMAKEMVEFTRNNIMEQAGTSMLTQANQVPQQLLSLLR